MDGKLSSDFGFPFSAAGLKKKNALLSLLKRHDVQVFFVSIFSRLPGKFFFKSNYSHANHDVLVPTFTSIPILNYIINPLSTIKQLRLKHFKKEIDFIIIYNCAIENVFPAAFMHYVYGVKVICQYEDGFAQQYSGIKGLLFKVALALGKKVCSGLIANSRVFFSLFDRQETFLFRGVVPECAKYLEHERRSNKKTNVLFASALDTHRGVYLIIDMFNKIPKNEINKHIRYTICGKGNESVLIDLMEAIDLYRSKGGDIEYVGFVSDNELEVLCQKADIFLALQNPNERFSQYCFPSKVFDYYPYGKQIISTDVSDLKGGEFKNLFFVDYNWESLRGAINDISCRIDHYTDLNKDNYLFMKENFNKIRSEKLMNNMLDKLNESSE